MQRLFESPPFVFVYTFTIPQSVIDDYGHVNNVAYVQWMQETAVRYGETVGYKPPENTAWFVREHHIAYLLPAFAGEELQVRTWVSDMKRVRLHRHYEFIRKSDGKTVAKGETDWVYVDAATGRPIAIPADARELFPVTADNAGTTAPAT